MPAPVLLLQLAALCAVTGLLSMLGAWASARIGLQARADRASEQVATPLQDNVPIIGLGVVLAVVLGLALALAWPGLIWRQGLQSPMLKQFVLASLMALGCAAIGLARDLALVRPRLVLAAMIILGALAAIAGLRLSSLAFAQDLVAPAGLVIGVGASVLLLIVSTQTGALMMRARDPAYVALAIALGVLAFLVSRAGSPALALLIALVGVGHVGLLAGAGAGASVPARSLRDGGEVAGMSLGAWCVGFGLCAHLSAGLSLPVLLLIFYPLLFDGLSALLFAWRLGRPLSPGPEDLASQRGALGLVGKHGLSIGLALAMLVCGGLAILAHHLPVGIDWLVLAGVLLASWIATSMLRPRPTA